MAEMVPVEFWSWVIPQVKAQYPDIIFIAEIYNPAEYENYIRQGKFDFLYDKVQLYDTLRFLISGSSSTADIPKIQSSLQGIRDQMLHFLENHDEQRIASRFFAGDPWKVWPAMVISATIDGGPVMIYFGQEVGEPGLGTEGFQGDDGRTTIFDYWGVPEHQKWMNGGEFDGGLLSENQKTLRSAYARLLKVAGTQSAIVNGAYADLTEANIKAGNFDSRVAAYIRYTDEEKLIVVANFHETERTLAITIPADIAGITGIPDGESLRLADLLNSEITTNLNNLSMNITLGPYSASIFRLP